ncbi:MAG: hypothetical protein F6K00_31880 [Leptolyngbya sp. SIOISBB]|nr:hypothetical protein [Leptolyngbya sp. SIOISBB]
MAVELLILTVYFICVVYVLYQMALSVEAKLEDQFEIVWREQEQLEAYINSQLQQQDLYQVRAEVKADWRVIKEKEGREKRIRIAFVVLAFFDEKEEIGSIRLDIKPFGRQALTPPIKEIVVEVNNQLPNRQVLINWDYSAISMFGQPGQRTIRKIPGQPIDLLPSQALTVVNPGFKSVSMLINEAALNRPENQVALSVGSNLIDFQKISDMKEQMRQYRLQMVMWVRSTLHPNSHALQIILPFDFQIKVLPDHVALPVLSWLLKFNPFALIAQKSR